MTLKAAVTVMILIALCSCAGNGSESLDEISKRRQCRANLNTICTDQANYCDAEGEWATDIQQLDEYARRVNPLVCPQNGEEYLLEQSDCGYLILCPAGHGSIDTGRRSWTGGN